MSDVSCNASVALKVKSIVQNLLDSGDANQFAHVIDFSTGLITSGTSSLSCDRGWADKERHLDKGESITYDLYDFTGIDIGAGDGCDANGQPIVLEEIILFAVVNDGPGRIRIEPAVSQGWDQIGTEEAGQGGFKALLSPGDDGYLVSSGSCNVTITALYDDCVVTTLVLGRSEDISSESSGSDNSSGA